MLNLNQTLVRKVTGHWEAVLKNVLFNCHQTAAWKILMYLFTDIGVFNIFQLLCIWAHLHNWGSYLMFCGRGRKRFIVPAYLPFHEYANLCHVVLSEHRNFSAPVCVSAALRVYIIVWMCGLCLSDINMTSVGFHGFQFFREINQGSGSL